MEAGFRARFLGRSLAVLWESAEPRPEGLQWSGLTGNYIRVVTEANERVDLANRVTETVITGELPGAMIGEARIRSPNLAASR